MILALALLTLSARASDPLLDRMAGTWAGTGERIELASGHRTTIASATTSTLDGDRLDSHNEITETDSPGAPRRYVRDYWIRPDGAAGYALGAGDTVSSHGRLNEAGTFDVEQDLGGLIVKSSTEFDAQGSLYSESVWSGDHELSRATIRYVRH
jgi:hypothetical protein